MGREEKRDARFELLVETTTTSWKKKRERGGLD